MIKNKKKLSVILFSIVTIVLIATLYYYNNNKHTTINIGVPLLDNTFHRYDILKKDLEDEFNINVNFIDLYSGLDINNNPTTMDLVKNIDNILDNNEVDMIIGIPEFQLEYAMDNNKFLDITDDIVNIDNLHKGIVDTSIKMGNGRIYGISPVFSDTRLVFQNELIFEELNIELLPQYVSWQEYLEKLDELQDEINNMQLAYYPLAFGVKNFNEDILFSGYSFLVHGLGLDTPIFEEDNLSERWKEFFRIYATIIAKYGKNLAELGDGIYVKDYAFVNGNYALMFADTYDVALFFSESFSTKFNETSPTKVVADFPITPAFINYDGSPTQNFRTYPVAINNNTQEKELAIDILNYILSKEYAYKIIDSYVEYSHFSNHFFNFPSYYDEDTIDYLNNYFNGDFDISILYDAEFGSVVPDDVRMDNENRFYGTLNIAFTEVYNNRFNPDLDYVIEQALIDMETNLNLIINSNRPIADGIDIAPLHQ